MPILNAQATRVNRGQPVPGSAGFGAARFLGRFGAARPSIPEPSPTAPVDAVLRDAYGYDILFTGNRFPLTPSGDYVRVEGIENLRAAIYRRLLTRKGEFRYRPEYGAGVQTYVKRKQDQATLDDLRQTILNQLSLERRISKAEVFIEAGTFNNVAFLKVAVKVVAKGIPVTFEPYIFLENA